MATSVLLSIIGPPVSPAQGLLSPSSSKLPAHSISGYKVFTMLRQVLRSISFTKTCTRLPVRGPPCGQWGKLNDCEWVNATSHLEHTSPANHHIDDTIIGFRLGQVNYIDARITCWPRIFKLEQRNIVCAALYKIIRHKDPLHLISNCIFDGY